MTPLRQRMIEDMQLSGKSPHTQRAYVSAVRQLAAYYEDEVRSRHGWGRVYGAAFDSEAFQDFWRQSARDVEDLGEFIRENVETWADWRKHKHTEDIDEEEVVEDDDAETEEED